MLTIFYNAFICNWSSVLHCCELNILEYCSTVVMLNILYMTLIHYFELYILVNGITSSVVIIVVVLFLSLGLQFCSDT